MWLKFINLVIKSGGIMQFYFFSSPDKSYAALFRKFAVKQNVATARILSVVILALSVTILISDFFVDYDALAPNYSKHGPGIILLTSSFVYYLAFFILKRIRVRHKTIISQFLSVAYAMIFLCSSMWLTFLAQHNPKNTMVFFMVGTFTVSVLWVLEVWESLIVMLLTVGVFYLGLRYFQTDPTQYFQNFAVAIILLVMFFAVSRLTFSYHYNYFLQVKLVEQKNREIVLANNAQRNILNIVTHDLRSPLNNITAITKLLQDDSTSEEERNEYYGLILDSVRDSEHIIQDLMDVAAEQAKESQKTEVCLNDFLKAIYMEWQRRMQNGHTLVLNEPFGMVSAYINPNKMRRVINNLIDNATKFTPTNGTITLELKKLEDKVRISVNDTGIGIPNELQPYLFDKFSRAGRTGLNGERSYGLGLSICLQIIQEHAGQLHIESKQEEGSSFHIDLPEYAV